MCSLRLNSSINTPADAPICAKPLDFSALAKALADHVCPGPIVAALHDAWQEEFLVIIERHLIPQPTESDWHDAEDWYTDGSLRVGQKLRWKSTSGHIFVGTREQANRVFFGLPGDERLAEYAYLAGVL